jgi:hypothetical protein
LQTDKISLALDITTHRQLRLFGEQPVEFFLFHSRAFNRRRGINRELQSLEPCSQKRAAYSLLLRQPRPAAMELRSLLQVFEKT